MECTALAYSQLNKPQYDLGCTFLSTLDIQQGYKVLDMGCGTGNVSNYIAGLVGPSGEVVGVDPDEERIKIAKEKYKAVENLKFFVGDSKSIPFLGEYQVYFDLHFSNFVFHWLLGDEKAVYIKEAYWCLKPGGRVAMFAVNNPLVTLPGVKYEYLAENEYLELCQEYGLHHVVIKYASFLGWYSSHDEFQKWLWASTGLRFSDCDAEWIERFKTETTKEVDGKVKHEVDGMIQFVAQK